MRVRGKILVIVLAGTLAACGGDDEDDEPDLGAPDEVETPTEIEVEETEDPTEDPTEEPVEETEEPEPETYEVRSGDTLSEIASEFDTTVDELIEANDLDDPDLLGVGEELVIP